MPLKVIAGIDFDVPVVQILTGKLGIFGMGDSFLRDSVTHLVQHNVRSIAGPL
jgi:hypothetical protein